MASVTDDLVPSSTPTSVKAGRDASQPGARPLLAVEDLAVRYPIRGGLLRRTRGAIRAVDGISFQIDRGETLGLVGESGSGKSSLGLAVLRLVRSEGAIRLNGIDIGGLKRNELRRHRRHMQMIFQDPYGSLDPRMKVSATLAEPLQVHGLAVGPAREPRVAELLSLVGLPATLADRYPSELSGGQRQRVATARALAVEPAFIVCDEPVSALDVSIQAQMLNLLVDLRARLGLTYLFIGHDLAVMRHISDRIAVMYLGRIVEIATTERLFTASGHPYTRALLSAMPVPDPEAARHRRRVILQGDIPSAAAVPPGCRFHTRCWLYEQLGRPERCRVAEPVLEPQGPAQATACHFPEQTLATDIGIVPPGLYRPRDVPQPMPTDPPELN